MQTDSGLIVSIAVGRQTKRHTKKTIAAVGRVGQSESGSLQPVYTLAASPF